jgi:hypothetical protein
MTKDPRVHDQNFWRYQSLLEAHVDGMMGKFAPFVLTGTKQSLVWSLAHIAKKIYEMGLEDGTQDAIEISEPAMVECQDNVCVKTKGVFN